MLDECDIEVEDSWFETTNANIFSSRGAEPLWMPYAPQFYSSHANKHINIHLLRRIEEEHSVLVIINSEQRKIHFVYSWEERGEYYGGM